MSTHDPIAHPDMASSISSSMPSTPPLDPAAGQGEPIPQAVSPSARISPLGDPPVPAGCRQRANESSSISPLSATRPPLFAPDPVMCLAGGRRSDGQPTSLSQLGRRRQPNPAPCLPLGISSSARPRRCCCITPTPIGCVPLLHALPHHYTLRSTFCRPGILPTLVMKAALGNFHLITVTTASDFPSDLLKPCSGQQTNDTCPLLHATIPHEVMSGAANVERGGTAAVSATSAFDSSTITTTTADHASQLPLLVSSVDETDSSTTLSSLGRDTGNTSSANLSPDQPSFFSKPDRFDGGNLDLPSPNEITRNELLRESVFPDWKDDAAGSGLESPEEMQKKDPLGTQIWKLYSRTKTRLPNQERMENLTWRMMAMNLRRREQMQAA